MNQVNDVSAELERENTKDPISSHGEIREALTPAEREAVYRFRYSIYVEQMGRVQQHADHENRRICEPLDAPGRIMAVFRHETVLGTCRINMSDASDIGFLDFWHADGFEKIFPGQVAVATKLMVTPSSRGSTLFVRLSKETVRLAARSGARVLLLDCNAPVKPFFERFGFVSYTSRVHPEYGEVSLMVLFFEDLERLKRIRSPLHEVLLDGNFRKFATA